MTGLMLTYVPFLSSGSVLKELSSLSTSSSVTGPFQQSVTSSQSFVSPLLEPTFRQFR